MKKYIVIIYILFSFSCKSQKVLNFLTEPVIQLEAGKNTNIRELLDIDGYYEKDSTDYRKWVFFEDGSYGPVIFIKGATQSDIKENMLKWIDGTIWDSYYSPDWGVYKIEGDTIICQNFDRAGIFVGQSYYSERFIIIDRRTIKRFYCKSISKSDEKYYRINPMRPFITEEPKHFVSADSLLSSDCWLKEKKWIWKNEQDWKNYKEKIKEKKKKKTMKMIKNDVKW